ncbi:hypothetical protein KR009_004404 [Drosophila setifemur]|nr:hypothetical protein KR009_004404 [Drosophila setifemur]
MIAVKSAKSEILLGIIKSDINHSSSMTNGNSLRSCLLLCTFMGLCSWTKALPFEYIDEHDDLDTAQSQAKYDARLLSQQMLSEAELQRQMTETEQDALDIDSVRVQGSGVASGLDRAGSMDEDLEPHSRAAACFTNGHKYTHGQKVPRSDACEVCLCMDGEIFCWWEKCDKANVIRAKAAATEETSESHNINAGLGETDVEGDGDYSDPYGHENISEKSTKVHTTAGKVGKRHKHQKNQNNFNDHDVSHSHRQKKPDYIKSVIMQHQQLQHLNMQQKKNHKTDVVGNYNIIKQHKHEQYQQKLSAKQHQTVEALAVNQAVKATHYQQPAASHVKPAPPLQQKQHNYHQHQQPHPFSKILNFPENLPALLYYDYKTEEHEHHQHQHRQQHLLHEKQRLLQQKLQQHKPEPMPRPTGAELGTGAESVIQTDAGVELNVGVGADKNFDEAETDSDILPEPPTKRPKAAPTQWSVSSSTAKALMTTQPPIFAEPVAMPTTTARATAATTTSTARASEMVTSTFSGLEKTVATVAVTNMQHDRSEQDPAEVEDAFHRWLTSTELNADNTSSLGDNIEQETPASTIIDDVGLANKSFSSSGHVAKNNGNENGITDAVFFRSSYNDYSSEFNGSVVNIDITLTAVDVHPRRQTDLIANGNRTSGVIDNGNSIDGKARTTMDPLEDSSRRNSSNQDNSQQGTVIPTYFQTKNTMPLAPGRMCNVLGKLYNIGDILPQDTGNCLQCICTDAVIPDEMPSVTCSPHNCPPLVLPDLFDATGY